MNVRPRAAAATLAIPPPQHTTSRGLVASASAGMSVVLISADPLLRAAWAQGLRRSGAAVVDESSTVNGARARIATGAPPDLIVLDTGIGVDRITNLAGLDLGAAAPVVIIGDSDTVGTVSASLQTARGYLFGRTATPPCLGPATGQPVDPAVDLAVGPGANGRRRGGGSGVDDVHGRPQQLSQREIEILQHAADGHTNLVIGDQLGLSPLTIKSHFSRIGRRLGSGDRAQLVLLALRSGAIT